MNRVGVQIRAKKLGVLIQDARRASHKSLEACAEVLGVGPETVEAYELGELSPSLPELEVLAYFLDIPLDHFWGNTAISESSTGDGSFDYNQLIQLRNRVVGTLLHQARVEQGVSMADVASRFGLPEEQIESYELGEVAIPLPHLELLSELLDVPLQELQDDHGPIGAWSTRQRAMEEFLRLPEELQAFVAKPVNQPYLELAQRLSEMTVDKLRAVGEGILEITL